MKKSCSLFWKNCCRNEKVILIKRSQMQNCKRFSEIILGGINFKWLPFLKRKKKRKRKHSLSDYLFICTEQREWRNKVFIFIIQALKTVFWNIQMIDMIILTELDKLPFHSLPSHYMSRYNLGGCNIYKCRALNT